MSYAERRRQTHRLSALRLATVDEHPPLPVRPIPPAEVPVRDLGAAPGSAPCLVWETLDVPTLGLSNSKSGPGIACAPPVVRTPKVAWMPENARKSLPICMGRRCSDEIDVEAPACAHPLCKRWPGATGVAHPTYIAAEAAARLTDVGVTEAVGATLETRLVPAASGSVAG